MKKEGGNIMAKQKRKTEKYNELVKEYRKLAKRADQRLVRLEQYEKLGGKYLNVTKFAYSKAMVDIRKWSGENAKRFNVKPPTSTISLKAKIRDIEDFLQSASSTIKPTKDNAVYDLEGNIIGGGIELTFDKRAATLNRKYGEYLDHPFTWDNIQDFFESSLYKKLSKKGYDSGTVIRSLGTIKQNKKQVAAEIAAHKPSHIHVDDMHVDDYVNKILRYYKKDIKSLF